MTTPINPKMSEPIHIISLGAGVQSSFLHKAAEKGAFGLKPTASIFADTMDEPDAVMRWLAKLKSETTIPILTVNKGNLMVDALRVLRSKKSGKTYLKRIIPCFLLKPDGKKALMGRQCTFTYKVEPVIRKIKEIVGKTAIAAWKKRHEKAYGELKDWERACKEARKNKTVAPVRPTHAWNECQDDPLVRTQIGISVDEASRVKESRIPFIRQEHPLVDNGIDRNYCASALRQSTGQEAPRSACKKCPFHADVEWLKQRNEAPSDFAESVAFEQQLQEAASRQNAVEGVPYLHEQCVPLDQVKLDSGPSHQQVNLFNNECEGLCGV